MIGPSLEHLRSLFCEFGNDIHSPHPYGYMTQRFYDHVFVEAVQLRVLRQTLTPAGASVTTKLTFPVNVAFATAVEVIAPTLGF